MELVVGWEIKQCAFPLTLEFGRGYDQIIFWFFGEGCNPVLVYTLLVQVVNHVVKVHWRNRRAQVLLGFLLKLVLAVVIIARGARCNALKFPTHHKMGGWF